MGAPNKSWIVLDIIQDRPAFLTGQLTYPKEDVRSCCLFLQQAMTKSEGDRGARKKNEWERNKLNLQISAWSEMKPIEDTNGCSNLVLSGALIF